ncbi:alpha/beta fold hydrolase [Desulfospira joergensenii]|uniref:alpha/beta fold hydrolase n=1 Tax=Desulfospira joergensenii TaxID=53329 RepID=UPI0003B61F18|nr:alpha/beta hydrolase [Desulfospira joergensenii]
MKIAAILLPVLIMPLSSTYALEYKGDLNSFEKFVTQYNLDWPVPKKIDYFEPIKGKGLIRYAHWIPGNEGNGNVVVHFNGRTEFIEKNIYTYKDLIKKGFEVWSLDWRGQGLSTHDLKEKQKHHISSFDEYVNDANYFVDKVINLKKYRGKKVLLAHSMGGQIALRYLLQERDSQFDFAILSSPLLKIPKDSFWLRIGNKIKKFFMKESCVLSKNPDWVGDFEKGKACSLIGSSKIENSELINANDTKNYSNDFHKIAEINCLIESSIGANGKENPDLRLACPTSNWLNAAFDSTDLTMELASKLNIPTLIVRAKPDTAVDPEGQDDFCNLSENCKLVSVPVMEGIQPGHELLIEKEIVRKFFFDKFYEHIGL